MHLLICKDLSPQEERGKIVFTNDEFDQTLAISQQGTGNMLTFRLLMDKQENTCGWVSLWEHLNDIAKDATKITIDITLLGVETIFHLMRWAKPRKQQTRVFYVAPSNYCFNDDDFHFHESSEIGQIPGFYSVAADSDSHSVRHVVILGFDQGRAGKFVERYNWRPESTIAVLTSPEIVPAGEQQALDGARTWLPTFSDINKQLIERVPADRPDLLIERLNLEVNQASRLDIVPLGLKTMTLGVAIFLVSLSDHIATRVRILTDFARPTRARSVGIGSQMSFSLDELLG